MAVKNRKVEDCRVVRVVEPRSQLVERTDLVPILVGGALTTGRAQAEVCLGLCDRDPDLWPVARGVVVVEAALCPTIVALPSALETDGGKMRLAACLRRQVGVREERPTGPPCGLHLARHGSGDLLRCSTPEGGCRTAVSGTVGRRSDVMICPS